MRRPLGAGFFWITLLFPPALAAEALAAEAPEAPVVDVVAARWRGPDGPLPFAGEEQLKEFLRYARIVSHEELTGGVNRPLKVRLEREGVEANAVFRTVEIRRRRARLDGKLIADFHDSHVYECAAYELSRMLGIDQVPPCVPRLYGRTVGTLQLWVEDARTEKDRREAAEEPPVLIRWLRQKQTMRLFDALIYNFDRNQGNMLIDPEWKLWFIDHTRSFRKSAAVEGVEKIIWCEREIWEKLQALDKARLARRLKPTLSSLQINQLLKRRDTLVDHLQARIDEMGEGAVIYDPADTGGASASDLRQLTLEDDIPVASSRLEDSG